MAVEQLIVHTTTQSGSVPIICEPTSVVTEIRQGPEGAPGAKGDTGDQGADGAKGDTGADGTPTGSSGAVQYNSGGAFGGDAVNFFWDDVDNRLGIRTATPQAPLDVTYNVGTTDPVLRVSYPNTDGYFGISNGTGGTAYAIPTFIAQSDKVIGYGAFFRGRIPSGKDGQAHAQWDGACIFAGELVESNGSVVSVVSSTLFRWRNSRDSKMVMKANGDLGLGHNFNSPTAKLHIQGASNTSGGYNLKATSLDGTKGIFSRNDGLITISGTLKIDTLLDLSDLPTTDIGLASGMAWNDSGTVKIKA